MYWYHCVKPWVCPYFHYLTTKYPMTDTNTIITEKRANLSFQWHLLLHRVLWISITCLLVFSMSPLLSMTNVARRHFSSNDIWESILCMASSVDSWFLACSLESCCSGELQWNFLTLKRLENRNSSFKRFKRKEMRAEYMNTEPRLHCWVVYPSTTERSSGISHTHQGS